jgi:phosphopantetheinyl transferase (holo-ACP synthase)
VNKPNEEFEKLIAPFEVMAGGLYSKECVKAVAQWAFSEAVDIAIFWHEHSTINVPTGHEIFAYRKDIAKEIQKYAKEVSNERQPRLH